MSTNNAELARVALTYPAIDNHAHPLLAEVYRDAYAFEGLISEASPGPGLSHDATTSLACYRATLQLAKLYGINSEQWEEVKQVRQTMDYATLCRICMQPTRIQCLLLDDGLGGVAVGNVKVRVNGEKKTLRDSLIYDTHSTVSLKTDICVIKSRRSHTNFRFSFVMFIRFLVAARKCEKIHRGAINK